MINLRAPLTQQIKAFLDLIPTGVFFVALIFTLYFLMHIYTGTAIASGLLKTGTAILVITLPLFSYILMNARKEEKNKNEKLFSLILNGLNDGVYDYNVQKGTIYYSPSYQKMMGYTQEELGMVHDDFYSLMHEDDVENARETMRQYLAREIPVYNNIFRMRHKNGQWMWIMSRGIGIWDENNRIQRLVGTHTDITIQKQREEDLKLLMLENERHHEELAAAKEKAEAANQAKGDFLAVMSHEIRTPLNVIIGLANIFRRSGLTKDQGKLMDTLSTNADILLKLLNDLLDLSRIEAYQIELEARPFSVDGLLEVVHDMFDGQASLKNIKFTTINNDGGLTFKGDATRILQILVNLVGNALKFTQKGSITIEAESQMIDFANAELGFRITDTGVGIAPEKLGVIFDKFVQADQTISRRFGGTGLGLSICESLAQHMGGKIKVESVLGHGSSFTLLLPLPVENFQKPADKQSVLTALQPLNAGKILVVEDYPANVMVITYILEELGYAAEVATSGAEAIQKITACEDPYAAILMDVQMQDMDGFDTTRRIRELEKEKNFHHKIICVTAHALAGDRARCLAAGMDDYITKPVHPDILAEKLISLAKAA